MRTMLRERPTQVLRDAVSAGTRLCSIFKEPTVTPTAEQARATRPVRVQADALSLRAESEAGAEENMGLPQRFEFTAPQRLPTPALARVP